MSNTKRIRKKRAKWDAMDVISFVLLTLLFLAIILPFWSAIVVSFETNRAYVEHPVSFWPQEFTLDNYKIILSGGSGLIAAYKHTIYITVVGTVCSIAVCAAAAYTLSRHFPGKRVIFFLFVFTMYFGGGLVPYYLLIKKLGLLNKYACIILPSLVSVWNIIIMKSNYESIPYEMQEAAIIDGANDLQIFARVMLPLQKPMLATFSLFTAVGFWNSWYMPMLMLTKGDKTVLQLYLKSIMGEADMAAKGLTSMVQDHVFSQGVKMACVLVIILPIMLVYPFLQKHFAKGMLVGAVKM